MSAHDPSARGHLLRNRLLGALILAGLLTAAASGTAAPVLAASPDDDCAAAEAPYAQYADQVPVTTADMTNAEHAVLYLVNEERAASGLPPLCWNDQLGGAARDHAEDWRGAERSCPPNPNWFGCSHWDSRPGYAWPEDRIAASGYGPCPGYCAGENTQYGSGVSDGNNWVPAGMVWGTPKVAVYWWMNHDGGVNGHRDAILRADWTDAGVGAAGFIDVYGNNGAAYVLDFGMH